MAYTPPVSDLARSHQHDASRDWPESVKIQILWRDKLGRPAVRSEVITANQFFGENGYGAPMSGDALIGYIERMRRAGPPKVTRGTRGSKS